MSTNTIIAIVVAAVIILGGGYYFMSSGSYSMTDNTQRVGDMNGDGLPDTDQTDTSNTKMAPSAAAFTGSFFDLAARGGNYKCDVNSTGASNDTTGTVFVSGTNLRGDFTTVASGKTTTSHMLKLADTMYVWSSAMPQGIMMKASAMMGQSGSAATQGSGVSGSQSYGWNCSATATNASEFTKPSGVDFIDASAMMGGGMMPKIPAQ